MTSITERRAAGSFFEHRGHRIFWCEADNAGGIEKTKVPVKLIDGRVDPISGAHMAAHYRELIPNANVTELAEAGHYPQIQAPREVLNAYLEFRDGIAKSSPPGRAAPDGQQTASS